jgi:hypothetical protein
MCQEVGHTFGLDHQDEVFGNYNPVTCMDYTNAPAGGLVGGFNYGPSNEDPNQHDYHQLVTIYSHLDTTNTGFQSVGRGSAGNDLSEWGRLIRSTNSGRPRSSNATSAMVARCSHSSSGRTKLKLENKQILWLIKIF